MSDALLQSVAAALGEAMCADQPALRKRLQGLQRRARQGKPVDRGLAELEQHLAASRERRAARLAARPPIDYPEELPVSERRAELAAAIAEHQVVVVAGETGSGKTTQLPKLCLELGRGSGGYIGHTQPRRLAARSVAARIASELNSTVGQHVGYKVRFTDHTSPDSYIKLMTDGILLAEIQQDPLLGHYDTLIVDEAHERSLNIDFLLGYLKRLLPKRPDLKLIITSATINTAAFAAFFDGAPVIEVSGRTYPVEVRYRPLYAADEDDQDRDLPLAIVDAVEEAGSLDRLGDILIFLPGEREIRASAEALRKAGLRDTEVVPLYARLSNAEQDRVFKAHRGRRIVLATNVAETSLTVPGIKFVIDSGLVRISRYSARTKVQRLPIEAVSRASADQRAGRCGRVSAGVCIRLFSEEDYLGRPQFTDPEIRRTNLASAILQMEAMGLGDIADFPFMDPPEARVISDGHRLLEELQALDRHAGLTPIGRRLARLPLDPRLGRMLLAAEAEGAVEEVLIIASALAVQDPRSRPLDAQQKADQLHREFADERSDFVAYINLWRWYHEQSRHLSNSKLRILCHDRLLSYVRLREWHDIHGQLVGLVRELKLRVNQDPADHDAIHRALLAGLLSHIGVKEEERRYLGARNLKLHLFPGSALYRKPPKWIVAAELVETTRLFARTAGAIQPQWLERIGAHLLKRSYAEPHWEKKQAQVAAFETITLYGLPIVSQRRVNYGPIDPQFSRQIFIRAALVAGEYQSAAPFLAHNRGLLADLEQMEAKARRRDIVVDDEVLYRFYDERLPVGIYSGRTFERWRKRAEGESPRLLYFEPQMIQQEGARGVDAGDYPDHLDVGGLRLALDYHFDPTNRADGVTASVPVAALAQLQQAPFDWLVPGMLEEKLVALIKGLPKALRKNFVPAVNFARAAVDNLAFGDGELLDAFGRQLTRMTGVPFDSEQWQAVVLPEHLRMKFRVVDERGKTLLLAASLAEARAQLGGKVKQSFAAKSVGADLEREGLTQWDFDPLPASIEEQRDGLNLRGYPTLIDNGTTVAIRVLADGNEAARRHRLGLRRLFLLVLADKVKYLRKQLPGLKTMCLHFATAGRCDELTDDLIAAAVDEVFLQSPLPADADEFAARLEQGRPLLVDVANRIAGEVGAALAAYHELAKLLRGALTPDRISVAAELKSQLEALIQPGFVCATPPRWRARLAVYLEAARLRLEKHGRQPQRDREAALALSELWSAYQQRLASLQQPPAELTEFRWLIEELRVSLFAQELKTVEKVSVERLKKRWAELRSLN